MLHKTITLLDSESADDTDQPIIKMINYSPSDRLRQVEWVVFDAVGTLITPHPPVAEAYWQAGRQFGSRLGLEEVRYRFRRAFRETEDKELQGKTLTSPHSLQTSETDERERWRRIVQTVFDDITRPEACFETLFQHFAQPASWRVYPDVVPTFQKLAEKGLQLGVASNFDGRLHHVLEGLQLQKWLSLRVISSEVGYRKPSPYFFRAVQQQAETDCDRIVFVGDDAETDIAGAQRAGMPALQIRRHLSESSAGILSDLRMLTDLLDTC